MRRLRPLLPLLVVTALCGRAEAQWHEASTTDPETLDEVRAAAVRSESGGELAIYTLTDASRVLGVFRLARGDADFLDAQRSPVLTIDDGPDQHLVRIAGELKSVSFLLWGGPGEPLQGALRDLMNGTSAVLRYPLNGGGFKEARFGLPTAKPTIAAVLGIAEDVDPDVLALAAEKEQALEACLAIEKKKPRERCMASLRACHDAEPGSADEWRQCLAQQ